jgi:multidrug efflux pump subunit AcrB
MSLRVPPTHKFIEAIRTRMQHDFAGVTVWFPPADMVAQILNLGLPAPIDVQIAGANQEANFQFASNLVNQIRKIPGAVDFRIQEPNNAPELDVTMDRTKASILGVSGQAIAILGALAGSQQNAINFWVDPTNVSHQDRSSPSGNEREHGCCRRAQPSGQRRRAPSVEW